MTDNTCGLMLIIFVEKHLLEIDGRDYRIWVDYEPDQNQCWLYLSQAKGLFLYATINISRNNYVPGLIESQLILSDGVHLYNDACKWVKVNHHRLYGTKLKNLIEEKLISHQIKDRRVFYDLFFLVGSRIVIIGSSITHI